jgi:hypothetical protein
LKEKKRSFGNNGFENSPDLFTEDIGNHDNNSSTNFLDLRNELSNLYLQDASGIICDDGDPCASFTGIWERSDEYDSYQNSSLNSEKRATHTWTLNLSQAGSYALYMWWSSSNTNCSSCPVSISSGGELRDLIYIDQRQDGGKWNLLGTYNFNEGNVCRVTIVSEGSNLRTCADAVKFAYMEEAAPEARIAFIQPNPVYSDQEICLGGYGIPGNGMIIQDYSWLSERDGEIGTSNSFCTSFLSEGIHRISFTVQDDAGTWSVPVEKTVYIVDRTPSQEIWLEAEEGTLAPPMETARDANTSNGEYILVPGGGNGMDPLPNRGYAEYSFEVFEAGDFVVWGRVKSEGFEDNSLWIAMDNGEHVLWDIQPGGEDTWAWNLVSNRGISGPLVYHLDAGTHILVIKNREQGTKLDKILITNDIDYEPIGVLE